MLLKSLEDQSYLNKNQILLESKINRVDTPVENNELTFNADPVIFNSEELTFTEG